MFDQFIRWVSMIFLSLLFDLLDRDFSRCISTSNSYYFFVSNNLTIILSISTLSSSKNPNKTLFLNSMYAFLSDILPSSNKYRKYRSFKNHSKNSLNANLLLIVSWLSLTYGFSNVGKWLGPVIFSTLETYHLRALSLLQ